MPRTETFETWHTAAGLCMTPSGFARAADVQAAEVRLVMGGWSYATRETCVFVADDMPPKLTLDGVKLMLTLLVGDEDRTATVLQRLARAEEYRRELRDSEPRQ